MDLLCLHVGPRTGHFPFLLHKRQIYILGIRTCVFVFLSSDKRQMSFVSYWALNQTYPILLLLVLLIRQFTVGGGRSYARHTGHTRKTGHRIRGHLPTDADLWCTPCDIPRRRSKIACKWWGRRIIRWVGGVVARSMQVVIVA